jgi:tetratricopeptide (TPR) repeat protein
MKFLRKIVARFKMNRALLAKGRGDYLAALEEYRQVLPDVGPEERAFILNTMGMLCYALKDMDTARSFYEQSIALSPARPETIMNLANCLHRLRDTVGAETAYQRARVASKDAPGVLYNYAVFVREEDPRRAADILRRCLEKMIQDRSDEPPVAPFELALGLLADIAAQQPDLVEETAKYFDVLAQDRLNGTKKAIENEHALMLTHAGRGGEALAIYRRILKDSPDNRAVQFNLGMALARLNRRTEALANFEALDHPLGHYGIGFVHEFGDEVIDAEREYRLFLEQVESFNPYGLDAPEFDLTEACAQHAREFINRHPL